MQEEIFVPLKLAGLKESILNDSEITPHFALNDALRPSIEQRCMPSFDIVLSSTCTDQRHCLGNTVWMDLEHSKSD